MTVNEHTTEVNMWLVNAELTLIEKSYVCNWLVENMTWFDETVIAWFNDTIDLIWWYCVMIEWLLTWYDGIVTWFDESLT